MHAQSNDAWTIVRGNDVVLATAIHDGHEVRDEVAARFAIPEAERLREEDPYTGRWTEIAGSRLVVKRSRFEVDLNRPRERAVYIEPADAWGLQVWRDEPPAAIVERSRDLYDAFYQRVQALLAEMIDAHGVVVVLDLHTYNHRREGPDGPTADPQANPEVNVGTGTLDRARFGAVADRFMAALRAFDFMGRHLDVRENVKFRGGHFSKWIHQTFPGSVCVLAVEFKKFFMDEWTGALDARVHAEIGRALAGTLPSVREGVASSTRGR